MIREILQLLGALSVADVVEHPLTLFEDGLSVRSNNVNRYKFSE